MSNSNRLPQIDILKSVSALAVFFLHYAGIYLIAFNNYNSAYLTPIRNLCFFAVPVFFIVSGFLHSGKEYSYKDILPKVIYFYILTVVTNFALTIPNLYIRHNDTSITILSILKDSLLLKTSIKNLWFMTPIMILYLFIPIFSSVKPLNIIILTILTTLLSFFRPVFFPSFNLPFPLPYYFSYFLIGYSIKHLSTKQKNVLLITSLVLFVICMIVIVKPNKFDYDRPLIFFLSLSIFLSLLSVKISNQHFIHIFEQISIASLGVYILHPVFIHFIFTYLKLRLSLPIFWAFFPILFAINVVFVLIIKKLLSHVKASFSKNN